jgi:hypothetical protein
MLQIFVAKTSGGVKSEGIANLCRRGFGGRQQAWPGSTLWPALRDLPGWIITPSEIDSTLW